MRLYHMFTASVALYAYIYICMYVLFISTVCIENELVGLACRTRFSFFLLGRFLVMIFFLSLYSCLLDFALDLYMKIGLEFLKFCILT